MASLDSSMGAHTTPVSSEALTRGFIELNGTSKKEFYRLLKDLCGEFGCENEEPRYLLLKNQCVKFGVEYRKFHQRLLGNLCHEFGCDYDVAYRLAFDIMCHELNCEYEENLAMVQEAWA